MKMDTLFAWLGINSMKKLFQTNYKLAISEPFIRCADNQLSPLFRKLTLLKIGTSIRLITITLDDGFLFEKGNISKLASGMQLPYLGMPVIICW